jgi:N-methylhydantoinase A
MSTKLRIGIDVGGTFTKAVAVDVNTMEVMATSVVPTTHEAEDGVAHGVVTVLEKILLESGIAADTVVFVAHSTTQATNALLEGDVAPVGVVGMGAGSIEAMRAKKLTVVKDLEIAPGRFITVQHSFVDTGKGLSKEKADAVVKELMDKGVYTIVASEAFGVDDPVREKLIMEAAADAGLPATGANEISKLYGLKVRTRTAVINASILTKMMETAEMTGAAIKKMGITAPLMVMRGDGGVMDIKEMKRRPILTALSGPAASVAGVLFYLKVSDGIYFEVGGTSTNIGVIKNGRPMVKHVEIGGHSTYLHSLDVRVLGVAGGSMPRLQGKELVDVGPRSAHIAGLPYSAFAQPQDIESPKLVFLTLKKGDPADYVGIETASGKRFALTNTCAANVFGTVKPGDYAYGNPESARKAFAPLAEALGTSVEEAARRVLEISAGKIIKVVTGLIDEYKLDSDGSVLVGGGGGAAALIPYVSQRTGLKFQISEKAEVISSIGDALAMIREMVERTIINPTPEDILKVRIECEQGAIASGAVPGSIECYVEVDSIKNRVTATAVGATEFVVKDVAAKKVSEDEQKKIAADSMRLKPEDVEMLAHTRYLAVFAGQVKKRGFLGFGTKRNSRTPLRILDEFGVIRLILGKGVAFQTTVGQAIQVLREQGEILTKYTEAGSIIPPAYLLYEARVFDMSGLRNLEEFTSMTNVELRGVDKDVAAVVAFSTD